MAAAPQYTTPARLSYDSADRNNSGYVLDADHDDNDDDIGGGSIDSGRGAAEEWDAREREEEEMEALLEAVERESGAEGKPAPEARRICCRFLLDAFRDGQFGRITLDSVPRRKQTSKYSSEQQGGWAQGLGAAGRGEEENLEARRAGTGGEVGGLGKTAPGNAAAAAAAAEVNDEKARGNKTSSRRSRGSSPDSELAERLVRDWSRADAWERPETKRRP